jgi:hypothetical protein
MCDTSAGLASFPVRGYLLIGGVLCTPAADAFTQLLSCVHTAVHVFVARLLVGSHTPTGSSLGCAGAKDSQCQSQPEYNPRKSTRRRACRCGVDKNPRLRENRIVLQ